ncbi:uncharacterized protein LOC116107676 [Pistacia vera]|uniref:uncharacterized protein LOC116107676 n=1 Tax=Pistacia vera TaxID=55513 RepID=UPI0012631A99|nr:uncharacterized protein LOC116107676 [Pistacia vera]
MDGSRSRNMHVSQTNISKIQDWVKRLLKRIEWLFLDRITNLESISHILVEEGFNELKYLNITSCESLVYIFDCKDIKIAEGEAKLLSSLEHLQLKALPKLSHIWKGDHQSISLCNLKRVGVYICYKLIKLFSPSLLKSLICLEEIYITECNNLEEIFEKKEALDEELDHTITSPSLGNLTTITIDSCDKLKNLFTPSIVKCLVKLKSFVLWSCSTIEEIVTNEKGEKKASIERIVFPSLYSLELEYLNSLTCFSSGSYIIEFPELEILKIWRCGKMKTFGYGKQVTPKLNKVIMGSFVMEERWNGNLNATVQKHFNEPVNQARRSA